MEKEDIKNNEELKPICHRLASRVRANIFVCTLAYQQLSALRWMINSSKSKDVILSDSVFIRKSARLEKIKIIWENKVRSSLQIRKLI